MRGTVVNRLIGGFVGAGLLLGVLGGVSMFHACGKTSAGRTATNIRASVVTSAATESRCSVREQLRKVVIDPSSATNCGDLESNASPAELHAARECVLAAAKEERAFVLHRVLRGSASHHQRIGIAGDAAKDGGAYTTYWTSYDGCPSGCGNGDPHTRTSACTLFQTDATEDSESEGLGLRCIFFGAQRPAALTCP